MIDIIIPAFNANKTIIKTLYSIINQENVNDLNVMIVDDNSDKSYDEICNFFKGYVKIKSIRLNANSGPGIARQIGIDNTDGEYIVFIDADDEFYDSYSLQNLYNAIQGYDISYGQMYYEEIDKTLYHDECLHGKMYRRDFIEKNNIKFNTYSSHEDNAFNQLCLSICKKTNFVSDECIIYRYNYNEKSITKTISYIDNLHLLVDSMNWLFENIEERKEINKKYVGRVITSLIHYFYFCYNNYPKDLNFLLKDLNYLIKKYKKYRKFITDEDELKIYKEFEITTIPIISVQDFINSIYT